MKRLRVLPLLAGLAFALVLALSAAGSALAFGPIGQAPTQTPQGQAGPGWGGYGPGGMMGGWYGARTPSGQMTVSADQARQIGQQWLDQYQPGSGTETPDQFYGYYTIHTLKDGKVSGMLSINGYTGQVWYHTWHGAFVQQRELAG